MPSHHHKSDRHFVAVSHWRRPYHATPPVWLDDDVWRTTPPLGRRSSKSGSSGGGSGSNTKQDPTHTDDDDLVDLARYEAAVAPFLLEEGDGELLDADAMVVTPSGNSSAAAHGAVERRRREERWTDLGLDHLLWMQLQQNNHPDAAADAAAGARRMSRSTPAASRTPQGGGGI